MPYKTCPFTPEDTPQCLALFDENCPKFFAINERDDYAAFLHHSPKCYQLIYEDDALLAAYGLSDGKQQLERRINWIMVSPKAHGKGIGRTMMQQACAAARAQKVTKIVISASHLSAPFFAKFGAEEIRFTRHGWGHNMHKVDMIVLL